MRRTITEHAGLLLARLEDDEFVFAASVHQRARK